MYLSKKEINNVATKIFDKPFKSIFMCINNQISVTKQIFLLHRCNFGKLDYLYFKSAVTPKMCKWIEAYSGPEKSNEGIVPYLNKLFIKDNFELYTYKSDDNINTTALDTNVYKSELSMGTYDNGKITITTKKYNNLLASDYQNIDVWAPVETSVSSANFRNKNMVPIWQKSMNVRNYDLENEGYSTTPKRASLNVDISGYGSNMTDLIKKKEQLYEKYRRS